MDAAQWSQQVACLTRPMEEITSTTTPPHNNNNNNPTNSSRGVASATTQQESSIERRTTRPQKDQIINCPRCNSTNTKFCYYNNYSLTQPRFFCKTCRRYWTQGGSLRNVPVGGGSRKNKRSSYSSNTSTPPPPLSSSTITPLPQPPSHNKLLIPDLNPPTSLSHLLTSSQNPNFSKFLEGQDLNLAFPMQGLFHHHHQLPKIDGNHAKIENYEPPININGNNSGSATTTATTTTATTTTSSPLSALELLRSGIASRGSMNNPFVHPMTMPDSSSLYHQSGYPNMQEFKPSMMNMFSSPSDHEHNNNNHMIGLNDDHHGEDNDNTNARLLFPFADMNKLASNTTQQHDHQIDLDESKGGGNDHHNHNHHAGYWSGMLGGGTW
ncbi:hypothetical protein vseg_009422 [Gypsophila vaccaria]